MTAHIPSVSAILGRHGVSTRLISLSRSTSRDLRDFRQVPEIPTQHPHELLAGHRPAGPLPPLGLGAGDELGAEALVEEDPALVIDVAILAVGPFTSRTVSRPIRPRRDI
jgi:hypothetical protein